VRLRKIREATRPIKQPVTFAPSFYRTAAVGSFLSVLTTLALIFLPELYGPPESFEHRLALADHPLAELRAWLYLVHPFLVLAAAIGVAAVLCKSAPGAAVAGFLGFLLWSFTEAAQQALTLVAYRRWAKAFAAADAAQREVIRVQVESYDAVWDSMFLLLLIGFLAGNLFFGWTLVKRRGFDRIIGVCFLAAALLTAFGISGEIGGPVLPAALAFWAYPAIQPLGRFLIGVWLWRTRINPCPS
jgi:hypothetical protein